ncbi:MAG TPA: hypothetical protein VFS08_12770 [Gemmatimonadaceae bacterium]|nr:hypothetical protein [Gemmatimonadaceae bacterium]
MPLPPDSADRRYSDHELALILRRAAERQAQSSTDGYSLREIQAIASEVGIDPAHVAEVALSLHRSEPAGDGAPAEQGRVSFDAALPGELTPDECAELVRVLRRRWDTYGVTRREPGGLVWGAHDGFGHSWLMVGSTRGRTKLELGDDRRASARVAGAMAGLGAFLAGFLALVGTVPDGGALVGLLVPLLGTSGAVGWGASRVALRRLSAKWGARVRAAGEELTATAREMLARRAEGAPPSEGGEALGPRRETRDTRHEARA